jgi:hypothetical protein
MMMMIIIIISSSSSSSSGSSNSSSSSINWTANWVFPGVSGTTIIHNTKVHITQNYTSLSNKPQLTKLHKK